jgi:hypothetical protein
LRHYAVIRIRPEDIRPDAADYCRLMAAEMSEQICRIEDRWWQLMAAVESGRAVMVPYNHPSQEWRREE